MKIWKKLVIISSVAFACTFIAGNVYGAESTKDVESENIQIVESVKKSGKILDGQYEFEGYTLYYSEGVLDCCDMDPYFDWNTACDVVIPDGTIAIGMDAFLDDYNQFVGSISIPESVLSIGEGAFCGCENLLAINLPSELRSIESNTFSGCTNLISITIPESVTRIGDNAFMDCANLRTISIPNSVTNIAQGCFAYCKALKEVNLPTKLEVIEGGAFLNCISLTNITIPDSVEAIGEYAFSGCTVLPAVTIPSNLNKLEGNIFNNCVSLTTITIPENITEIPFVAFNNCSSLHTIVIPESVTTIDRQAFVGCANNFKILTTVNAYAADYAREEGFKYILTDSVEQATVTLSASSYKYDATAKKPVPTVKVYNKTLKEGVDYLVEYKNNTNVGTATVIITGIDDYSGTISKTYKITPATLTKATVTLSYTSCTYSGAAKKPTVTVTWNDKTLKSGTDYTVTYASNTNVGTATVTVTGKGNFKDSIKKTFTIKKLSLASATVKLSATSFTYNTKAQKPTVSSVVLGSKTLKNGTDYKVTYKNNTNVGTATVTITGAGNYSGTVSKTFTIKKASVAKAKVTLASTSVNYTGKALKPAVKSVVLNGVTLKNGTHYKVTYKNNTNAGKATVTITGIGNCTGTVSATFTINVKTGTVFTYGDYKYKVTGASTVAFAGLKSTKTTKVTIPTTAKYAGKTFNVTSIAASALAGCSKVTSVVVGANITSVGNYAFYNCKSLKTITFKSTKVKTVGKSAFGGIHSSATIKVPSSKLTSYKTLFKGKGQGSKVVIKKA